MSSQSSSELGKRKIITISNINSSSPIKKYKKNNIISNINYSFPSILCIDYFYFGAYFKAKFNNLTLSITNNKNVVSFGYSSYLSHGFKKNIAVQIKQITNLTNIKMIDGGDCHSICLNYNGDIFSFGSNEYGQLGIGKKKNELKQTHIPQTVNIPPCKQISCGNYFTMCLTYDNILYSFGANNHGELGLGNNRDDYNFPQLIPDFNNIEYIVCGGTYSICKTYNNEFYYWGDNEYGQLGQGNDNSSCNKPIQCLNWPDNIISIKCGTYHTLLLTSEGQAYSFGYNNYGQLGINDKGSEKINMPRLIEDVPEIQRIECGNYHSMCIDINNNLWLFDNNYYGQLGLGDTEHRYKPIIHPTLSNIIDVSSGGYHTFVKTIDNKIYAFGNNNYSQLGIETTKKHQLTPIQVLQGKEDIWCSTIGKSRQKSARK